MNCLLKTNTVIRRATQPYLVRVCRGSVPKNPFQGRYGGPNEAKHELSQPCITIDAPGLRVGSTSHMALGLVSKMEILIRELQGLQS